MGHLGSLGGTMPDNALGHIIWIMGLQIGLNGGFERCRQFHRVGTHVGDQSRFVKGLGDLHGVFGTEAQLRASGLLHRGGNKGGRRRLLGGFAGNADHLMGAGAGDLDQPIRFNLTGDAI